MELESGLTVICGPNGVGKSNVGRCLALARAVLAQSVGHPEGSLLDQFSSAGYRGASSFSVALQLTFDQAWEKELLLAYFRAVFAMGSIPWTRPSGEVPSSILAAFAQARLVEASFEDLWSGTLHIRYDARVRSSWYVAWEFRSGAQDNHIVLRGRAPGEMRAGAADPAADLRTTTMRIEQALLSTVPAVDFTAGWELVEDRPAMSLANTVPSAGMGITINLQPSRDSSVPIPQALLLVASELGVSDPERFSFSLIQIFWEIVRRTVSITENRRIPFVREYLNSELDQSLDLSDGSRVPAELFRLKNGTLDQRRQYERVRRIFSTLTSRELELRSMPVKDASEGRMFVDPVIVNRDFELPIQFSGAGVQEALILSVMLSGDVGRLIVLDEPAVNVEPTMQRRFVAMVRETAGQWVVITHSADLLVADRAQDLRKIIRLSPTSSGCQPSRLDDFDLANWARWSRLLEPADVRALLFAAGVVLCEGPTEVGALRQWWRDGAGTSLPNPEAANIPIISVNGDNAFGGYIKVLDAFRIPWVAVADGPALLAGSGLTKQLNNLGYDVPPPTDTEFEDRRRNFASMGIFTVADNFGGDGTKSGEFEAFLRRVDAELLDQVTSEIGLNSKPQIGALFASRCPAPPDVVDLYRSVISSLARLTELPAVHDACTPSRTFPAPPTKELSPE